MRVKLLDLGVGNLHSLAKAIVRAYPGAVVEITDKPSEGTGGELLVLPGVGAFSAAAARLLPARKQLREALLAGMPAIGICLGMQLLFEASEEGPGQGLGVCPGKVTRLSTPRTPHMGFSRLHLAAGGAWHPREKLPDSVYYAHSFACRPADESIVAATTKLDRDAFPAIIRSHNVVGFQFHPEKSSDGGIALLSDVLRELCP